MVCVVGMGPFMDEQVLREMAGQAERFFPAPSPHLIRAVYSDMSSEYRARRAHIGENGRPRLAPPIPRTDGMCYAGISIGRAGADPAWFQNRSFR